ncbi:MAG TPA: hypothetical protein PLU83_10560 [Phycicoccus sp.]|nr:hypothetical protein [Phycicoccus sp.]
MDRAIFPDNTVLCNFAAVDRIDLLETWLRGRGRWTEAVAFEAGRSANHLPDLRRLLDGRWLGEPIEFDADEDVRRIEHLRRDVFGGTGAKPLQHLGEAQTCHLLQTRSEWRESIWVSDDRDALDYARFIGVATMTTPLVLESLVAEGDVSEVEAARLLRGISER